MKNAFGLAAVAVAALTITAQAGAQAPRQHGPDQITRAQVLAMVEGHFAKADANKDGRVTREEMQLARQQFAQSRGGKVVANRQAPKDGPRPHGGMGMMGQVLGAAGALTLDEARAMGLRHFDHMDANKDGTVTRAERQQMMQMMRGMKGHDMSGQKTPGK